MFKWKKGKDIGLVALDTVEAMRHHDTYRQDWHAHPFWETHYILSVPDASRTNSRKAPPSPFSAVRFS